jgi:hypothetical protein
MPKPGVLQSGQREFILVANLIAAFMTLIRVGLCIALISVFYIAYNLTKWVYAFASFLQFH